MQKKLLKMSLSFGLDGKTGFRKETYVDNVPSDGRVFQEKGSNSQHKIVDEGQMWVVYDDTIDRPYWTANVIVGSDRDQSDLAALVVAMSNGLSQIVSNSFDAFRRRLADSRISSNEKALSVINGGLEEDARKYVCVDKNAFVNDIYWKALASGKEMCRAVGKDEGAWERFYKGVVTTSIIDGVMSALSVLRIDGDAIKFENVGAADNAKDILVRKISSDAFMRFREEEGKCDTTGR